MRDKFLNSEIFLKKSFINKIFLIKIKKLVFKLVIIFFVNFSPTID